MMLQLIAVIGLPLAMCFIIIFMPFIGKYDEKYNNQASVDGIDVNITKLVKLLDKEAADRRVLITQSRFKYTLAGYKEG